MPTWVVGAGGLLGTALTRCYPDVFAASPVPWIDPGEAIATLIADLHRFADEADGEDWALLWAAGHSVVASSASDLDRELEVFAAFLTEVGTRPPAGRGAFFLASSAGGVYAGSSGPPFSEESTPVPLSAYGEAKLRQEWIAQEALAGRVPLVVGRLSNLFGPGQDLSKPQGLISQLCLAAVSRRAMNLYVPMETLRDYLYVDDAARMIRGLLDTWSPRQPDRPVIRNLASERPVPVAAVLRTVERIARRNILVGLGSNPASRYQVRDLRVTTAHPAEFTNRRITPLPVGVKVVFERTLADVKNARYRFAE